MVKRTSRLYLLGLFVSALGSLTYAATLPAILASQGVALLYIGALIGTLRLNGFATNFFLGQVGDKLNPVSLVVASEFLACVGSLLIWASWKTWGTDWLVPFFLANNVRVFFTTIQGGSIQKIGKHFDVALSLGGRFSVAINAVTNGALMLGGTLALVFFKNLNIEALIIFDAATFIVNGVLILFTQTYLPPQTSKKSDVRRLGISSYYSALPTLALFDLILSLVLCGSNTLNIRLLESVPGLIPIMPTMFGTVAFVCSILSFDRNFSPSSRSLWAVLGMSLFAQACFVSAPFIVIGITVVRNFAYWTLYNSIGREMMKAAEIDKFAAVAAGRNAITVGILAIGELWVGASKAVPLILEMSWRTVLAFGACFLEKDKLRRTFRGLCLAITITFGVKMEPAYSDTRPDLVIPIKKLPTTLDPQNYEDLYSMIVILQVHRGLMRFLPNLEIACDLAQSYKVLNNGKRIQFHLAERYFSSGERIKPAHVVNTFLRMFREKAGFSADISYIKGAKDAMLSRPGGSPFGVRVVDAETVEFELEKPSGLFLAHLATPDTSILPLNDDLKYDWKLMAGAGPYTVRSLSSEGLLLIQRDPNVKSPKSILIKPLSQMDAQQAAIDGHVDTLDGYGTDRHTLAKLTDAGWQQSVTTLTRQLFIVMNPSHLNLQLRATIQDAISSLSLTGIPPSYQKAYGIIPIGLPGAIKKSNGRLLVAPAHHKKRVSVELCVATVDPVTTQIADLVKAALEPHNISVKIVGTTIEDYLRRIEMADFQLILRSKFLDYPDGYSALTYFRSNTKSNTFFVNDTAIDRKLDQAARELAVEKRANLYREIQRKILSKKTIAPVAFGSENLGLWAPKVLVPPHPLGLQGLAFETLTLVSSK